LFDIFRPLVVCYNDSDDVKQQAESIQEHSMATVVKTEHPHIVRVEGVCGGEPVIDGLRVTVRQVATLFTQGESIAEIAEVLSLTEAQIVHALSYFFDHREEIETLIAQEEAAHARFGPS
jgi:uncharacterized protein (DUF433 family)